MYKLLFLLLFSLLHVGNLTAQVPTTANQGYAFEKALQGFNKNIERNKTQALVDLTAAEAAAQNLGATAQKAAQIDLALAFARLGNLEKTTYYQQKATAITRGSNSFSIANLNKLAQSYILQNDTGGLNQLYQNSLAIASKSNKTAIQISYVNSLFGSDRNAKAATVLTELYADTPLSPEESAEILSLLIINSIKLNQRLHLEKYYTALLQLNTPTSANITLAKAMYLMHKNQYRKANDAFKYLFNAFKQGKRETVYLEGVLQLAHLNSLSIKKDSAEYYFNTLAKALKKPYNSTAIGIRYLKLRQMHQRRFNEPSVALNDLILSKDSLYNKELIALTKELTYKYKIETDKQKVALLNKKSELAIAINTKNKQQALFIITVLSLLLVSGAVMIYNLYHRKKQSNLLYKAELARLKQLHQTEVVKKLAASQEAERWRIADQLHDEVGSMLSVARLNLSENPYQTHTITPEKLATANKILADVADTIRAMSHELMPVAIRQYGLINAIEQLINNINTSGKIYIEHFIYGFTDCTKYPEDFQISFYRIVQELFQNMVKHSKASNAIFQLIEHPDSINLYIEDNGKGIEHSQATSTGKGIGLLANRIDYYDGKISIEGQPGKGTLIVIDIPTTSFLVDT